MSRAEYQREWKQKNAAHVADYNKKYQKEYFTKNPHKYIFWSAKQRAKKLDLPFDITPDDCIAPEVCPILGIPLVRSIGSNGPSPNSPSLDRIRPELGYVKGNVQVISQRANVMKNDASPEELRKFCDWVKLRLL